MIHFSLFFLCFYLFCVNAVYYRVAENLTVIPWSAISDSEKSVILTDNFISNVDDVPTSKQTSLLGLAKNLLTTFPNLVNLSSTLQVLWLGENQITHINPQTLLSQLTLLKKVGLTDNRLVSVPDVQSYPPRLEMFLMTGNMLTTLPNMCKCDTSQSATGQLQINPKNNRFVCDVNMVWTKLAFAAGIIKPKFTCDSPQYFVGKDLDDIKVFDLLGPANGNQFFMRLTNPERFYCYPKITSVQTGVSRIQCGRDCIQNKNCALFAVDNGTCVISEFISGSFGTRNEFLSYQNWYIVR